MGGKTFRIPPVLYMLAAIAVIVAARQWLLSWHGGSGQQMPPGAAMHATVFPDPGPMPEFALTDHHGQVFTRENLNDTYQAHLLFVPTEGVAYARHDGHG